MKVIAVVDENGEPRPVHKIAEDFTNEFINESLGLPIGLVATRLGLELCTLIAALRGEEIPDGRFSIDD